MMTGIKYQCTSCKVYHNSVAEAANCKQTCLQDKRNVVDVYKYWKTEAIKAELDTKRHNFSVLITNHFHDFNIGSVIRNSNAFLGKNVYVLGRRKYDSRGAVGTNHYENIIHIENVSELPQDALIVGFDDLPNAKALDSYIWPQTKHVIMCFGQESVGLTDEVVKACRDIVYIRQFGSVRSLNVGCASAIAMYSYCHQLHRG
jgi:tRNA G18 (ribose-2'-O)-methylase SpoU